MEFELGIKDSRFAVKLLSPEVLTTTLSKYVPHWKSRTANGGIVFQPEKTHLVGYDHLAMSEVTGFADAVGIKRGDQPTKGVELPAHMVIAAKVYLNEIDSDSCSVTFNRVEAINGYIFEYRLFR